MAPAVARDLEAYLLEAAVHTYPANVGKLATAMLARVDQDGVEPRDEVLNRRRGFSLHTDAEGWSKPSGFLSPRLTAVLKTVFDSLAAPQPSQDGSRDERSHAQRQHDGLLDGMERVVRSGGLPDVGGAPVTVLVTVSERELRERAGHAITSHGDLLPIKQLVRMAAEAELIPVYLTDTGGIATYGRAKRLATPAQRRALAARDRGCTRPGCTAPPGWCEVHHVVPWAEGGGTDLGNMLLACPRDHDLLDQGWDVVMREGVPLWLAPAWIDPVREPRRNTAHHLPITFTDKPRPPQQVNLRRKPWRGDANNLRSESGAVVRQPASRDSLHTAELTLEEGALRRPSTERPSTVRSERRDNRAL